MKQPNANVLAINGGSSSIKFAVYTMGDARQRRLHGKLERIGLRDTTLTFDDPSHHQHGSRIIGNFDHHAAANFLIGWLEQHVGLASLAAVGHRIVNGGADYDEPQRVTPELLDALRRISAYAPEHLPAEIALIDLFRERVPKLSQVVCFDTAFHRAMPRVAKILPIPRRLQAQGVERYGFHGLSYAYLMQELARVAGREAIQGRIILAHLGNGASLAAVRDGNSIDTSMSFTPTGGVMMGTRSGDLDPGLVAYLAHTERMTTDEFDQMVNYESGLLGVSETSSDMRDLLAGETDDVRVAEALALFCYQIKKCIGAYAAALGGLDTLVFAGGIGEHAAVIRARICEGLGFLGVDIDETRNAQHAAVISADASRVTVRVMHTDEEAMIAKSVYAVLDKPQNQNGPL